MGQVEMQLAALGSFQRESDAHAESIGKILQKLEAARVGQESFGKIPGSGEVFSGYEERVSNCLEAMRDCKEALSAVGEMVKECADEQQRNDDHAMAEFERIMGEIGAK